MYSYYAAKSMGVKTPKPLAMTITFSQMMQMLIGTYVTFYAFTQKKTGNLCETNDNTIIVSLFLYGSYLILFANFFVQSYLKSIPWKKLGSFSISLLDYIGVRIKYNDETIILNNNIGGVKDRMTKKIE
jgi:hypothetical protein